MNKYDGMTCLVVDELGEIMLLIIGYLDRYSSNANKITTMYGDLFRITNIPTTIQK